MCRTKARSEVPPRSDVPEIVDVSIQGLPGSVLGMMFAHDAISPCNSNPVWIREVASLLESPESREKALDNLKLSLASGRHLQRILPALDSIQQEEEPLRHVPNQRGRRDDGGNDRDLRGPNSESGRNKRGEKYDRKFGGPK